MKKLFVILLTLLMVAALPLCVMAESATEAATAADNAVETDEEGVEIIAPETEVVENEGAKTSFGFFPETALVTLPIMGMGMLGIFLVTCVIILAVLILSKFGGQKDEES